MPYEVRRAGQNLVQIFKDSWPDPSVALGYKLYSMNNKHDRNMVTYMRWVAEHTLVFAINGNIFQAEEKIQYSITPSFHHSDCGAKRS